MRIGYARVSTNDQSTDAQLQTLQQAGCEKVFTEVASGSKSDRPELARLIDETLRSGDTLVIWKLDRLVRSIRDLIAIADDFKTRGIELVSLTDKIDTNTSSGKLHFNMLAVIAEFERDLIRERTKAGLAEAKRRGRNGGRPKKFTKKDTDGARLLMASNTMTAKEVAAKFKVSVATLYRHLASK